VLNKKEPVVGEGSFKVKNKEEYFEARLLPFQDGEIIILTRNITERKLMKKELKYYGMHDRLTGLYNRAYLEKEMKRLERGRINSLGVIMCDVDGLKLVNDTLGHEAGDRLLIAAARIIKNCFRQSDTVARIGGDEFAILLPDSDKAMVDNAYQRLSESVDAYNNAHQELFLNISIGYAASRGTPLNIDNLFREADNNMYREKLHHSRSARSAIVQTLMKALEARDFNTEGHANRLQDLVVEIAKTIDFPAENIADLRLLAQFHDIGKVGVPDRILFKPGPLDDEEFFWKCSGIVKSDTV